MNQHMILGFVLNFMFPGASSDFQKLLERLIVTAETVGGDGDAKKRAVLRKLLEWAQARGFLGSWPQPLREAALSLAIEFAVFAMSQAMKLNQHKAELYAPKAVFPWPKKGE